MSTINRHIVSLEMLHQDLLDCLEQLETDRPGPMDEAYLKLLEQFMRACENLLGNADSLTERHFAELMKQYPHTSHISSRRMLAVQVRLLQFVCDYYAANNKVLGIRLADFGSEADTRLELLQTKATKARNQFKTVVQAMGAEEYQTLIGQLALPVTDWSWQRLGLQ